jgi:DNA (cytosine-5)-methyltransferase 1
LQVVDSAAIVQMQWISLQMHGSNARANSRRLLSLFSGCGGFDLGFVQEGFNCIGAFDIDPVAISTHRRNLCSEASVADLTSASLQNIASFRGIDVVLAGSPCQGFSTAGKRDVNDPRNSLLLSAGRIALQVKPRVFIVENVPAVMAGSHRKYWDELQAMLCGAGYRCAVVRCTADRFGLPQIRARVVLIAIDRCRNTSVINLPARTEHSIRDVISDLQGARNHEPFCLGPGTRAALIAKKIQPRQKLCNVRSGTSAVHTWEIPEVFGTTTRVEREILEAIMKLRRRDRLRTSGDADPVTMSSIEKMIGRPVEGNIKQLLEKNYLRKKGKRFDLTHTFNGKFRRLSWDHPSCTVDTRFGDPQLFLHPGEERGFTVREAARIQGFPDTFVFEGSRKQQFTMVGNAVPPPMARWIATVTSEILK